MTEDMFTQKDKDVCEAKLHRLLSWVGSEIPREVELECGNVQLRDVVYNFLTKENLSEEDIKLVRKLLSCLEKRQLLDEELLGNIPLSRVEGERLCLELAGLLRAIMDLRDVEVPRQSRQLQKRGQYHKVEDLKRWSNFVRELKKI